MSKIAFLIIKYTFSLSFIKSLAWSFVYYVYEHVVWRGKIHKKKTSRIHSTASIKYAENLYIGENTNINHLCCIWAGKNSKIILGDNILMGPGVKMFGYEHGAKEGMLMNHQPLVEGDIVVGDDVLLGANAIITSGVKISKGVVVAAGAVVTRDVAEENAVVAGVPAKIIGYRQ